MAQYNQNFAELSPEKLPTGWPWRFLIFALILFMASLLTYIGLSFGYRPYLQNQIAAADQAVNKLAASVPVADQEKLVAFYSQIVNLKSVLDNHIIASKILPFLEKNTNRRVYYNRLDVDVNQRSLSLEGVAENYEILAQQLEAFNQAREVERFLINESQLVGDRVRFKASIILSSAMFK